jgi:hypothetical protein
MKTSVKMTFSPESDKVDVAIDVEMTEAEVYIVNRPMSSAEAETAKELCGLVKDAFNTLTAALPALIAAKNQ